jgi:pyroglutamyl-peptidase
MSLTVLLTGFGPFPGAPFNPTGPLVEELARRRHRALIGVRRVGHIFPTSYAAVDRDLPALIARERPDLILMFGLAQRTKHLRIETCARNAISRLHRDASGQLPMKTLIAPDAPAVRPMSVPTARLVAAARASQVPVAPSHDAGRYLCNYLCWRACEASRARGGPRLIAFVHVPSVGRATLQRKARRRRVRRPLPLTLDHLIAAGEAMLLAACAAARMRR